MNNGAIDPFELTESQMQEVDASINLIFGNRWLEHLAKLPATGEKDVDFSDMWIQAGERNFRAILCGSGGALCGNVNDWEFEGTVVFWDYYDFGAVGAPADSHMPPFPSNIPNMTTTRSSGGDKKAKWAKKRISGKGFTVSSVAATATASSVNPKLQIVGGGGYQGNDANESGPSAPNQPAYYK